MSPEAASYPGPADALARYEAIVAAHSEAERRGAKNPYTSVNGWMSSFLDPDGAVCLRMAEDDRTRLIDAGEARPTQQYGSNMPEFVTLAPASDDHLGELFAASWSYTAGKPPK